MKKRIGGLESTGVETHDALGLVMPYSKGGILLTGQLKHETLPLRLSSEDVLGFQEA